MDYLPIYLDLRQRPCLVVGGGQIALHKVELLLRAGARVRVVAPRACDEVGALAEQGRIELESRGYRAADLEGVDLVVAATDDRGVNQEVSTGARQRNLPVNVVDDPELCSFIVPAIVDRDPVVVAVSTSGASPALARRLRERLEEVVSDADGALASLLARHRRAVQARFGDLDRRRRFYEAVLASDVPTLCRDGRLEEAERSLAAQLAAAPDVGG